MPIEAIRNAVLTYNKSQVIETVGHALDAAIPIAEILNDGLIAAMEKLGDGFERGTLFVPEMLLGAITMKTGLEILEPLISRNQRLKIKEPLLSVRLKAISMTLGKTSSR